MTMAFRVIIAASLLLIVSLAAPPAPAAVERWKNLGSSAGGDSFHLDTMTITYGPRGVAGVSVKIVPVAGGGSYSLFSSILEGLGSINKDFAYVVEVSDVDCAKAIIKQSRLIFYDRAGRILDSASLPDAQWRSFLQGGIDEDLYKAVCVKR